MFYDDILKRVTDMLDKGHLHNSPFAFKLNANTFHNFGLNYKGEFTKQDNGLGIDWEYIFRYSRSNGFGSILCSNSRVEGEGEFWFSHKRRSVFKAKLGVESNLKLNEGKRKAQKFKKDNKWEEPLREWNIYADTEFKYHKIKHFYGSIKLIKDSKSDSPTVKVAGIYKLKPQNIIMGGSLTLDRTIPKPSFNPIELLIGAAPHKNLLYYLKHSAINFIFPGKFTAGVYRAGAVEVTWPKIKKDQVINKVYQYRVQAAAEAFLDMVKDCKIKVRGGVKLVGKKGTTLQTIVDHDLTWTTAFTYRPIPKLSFTLSGQLDLAKPKKDPKKGFSDCGFTIELSY
eukprot:TRINITY_DN7034_c0_g3_i2.p1 TRINITY_DN7034_c0_g3~~TRINITY_DN7034_c0_g3_i2.p1  ORF type:complete len:341 (-),score=33.14 TRINITY_DN7034_c0_g3_i2:182-1204(-)